MIKPTPFHVPLVITRRVRSRSKKVYIDCAVYSTYKEYIRNTLIIYINATHPSPLPTFWSTLFNILSTPFNILSTITHSEEPLEKMHKLEETAFRKLSEKSKIT